jgi:hypothetical protein
MLPFLIAGGAMAAGGIANYLSAKNQQEAQQKAMNNYNSQMQGYLNSYNNSMGNNISAHEFNSQGYLNSPDKVQAWLNPNMDYQMSELAKANNQQYAANNSLLSGGAIKALSDRQQNLAKLSWNDAFNQMNASNNQGLGNLNNITGMKNDFASNKFNAQQGMASNQLNAAMGQRQAGAGDFFNGMSSGANLFGNVMNAFRPGESNKTF